MSLALCPRCDGQLGRDVCIHCGHGDPWRRRPTSEESAQALADEENAHNAAVMMNRRIANASDRIATESEPSAA